MIGWGPALKVGLQNGCFDYFHTGSYHNIIDLGPLFSVLYWYVNGAVAIVSSWVVNLIQCARKADGKI